MNDSVFFVVEPIAAQNPFDIKIILFAIFCATLIYIFLWIWEKILQKSKQQKKNPNISYEKIEYIFPEISDKNFEEKIFILLQNFVKEKYLPKNTLAHSFYDVAKYCNNENILSNYQKLETIIFQKKILSEEEKIFFTHSIKNIVTRNTK